MKLRRRIGSVFLAFAMALSLIPSVAVSALAATAGGNDSLVTLEYENDGFANNYRVNVSVYTDQSENPVKEFSVSDARMADNDMKITVVDSQYEIDHIEFDGVSTAESEWIAPDLRSYSFTCSFVAVTAETLNVSVYLRPVQDKPEIEGEVYDGYALDVSLRVYESQLLKMLHLSDQSVTVTPTTEIKSIKYTFHHGINDAVVDENHTNRENDYWDTLFLDNYHGWAVPYNVKELNITYKDSANANEQTVIIPAGDLRFVRTNIGGQPAYEVEAEDQSTHIVYFYNETNGNAGNNYFPYAIRFVNDGESLGDQMPVDPTYQDSLYQFVNWEQNDWDGDGMPFLSTTIINDDVTVFARKISSSAGGTQINISNEDDLLFARVAELANEQYDINISASDLKNDNVKISVFDATGERTNEDDVGDRWMYTDEDWYLVNSTVGLDHIDFSQISGITVYFTLAGSDTEYSVDIPVGEYPGDISVRMTAAETIVDLVVNSPNDVQARPDEPGPEPTEPAITDFSKDLVERAANVPEGITASDYTFPENGTVIIPYDESVTLLYAITVTGEGGTEFTVTDDGAALVSSNVSAGEEDGTFTGSIPEAGAITFYVSKTFTAEDITEDGNLTNTAKLTGENAPEEGGEDTEEVDAKEETNTVYVYVQFVKEDGSTLSEEDKQLIESTYGTGLKEDGYMPIGYFDAAIPSVDGYNHGDDQFNTLLGNNFVLNNNDITAWATGVTQDNLNLAEDVTWTKLSVAHGALDFGDELKDDCWHLDGRIQLYAPDIDVTKTLTKINDTEYTAGTDAMVEVGDQLTWTITVTNSGNAEATDLTLSDTLVAVDEDGTTSDRTANVTPVTDGVSAEAFNVPAATTTDSPGKVEFTATYTVTAADKGLTLKNTATVTNGDDEEEGEGSTENEVANPAVDVIKALTSATRDGAPVYDSTTGLLADYKAQVGDVLTYTITVENTGNVDLENVMVEDTLWEMGTWLNVNGEKAPAADDGQYTIRGPINVNASVTITYTYTVQDSDVAAGEIKNTAGVYLPDGDEPGEEPDDTDEVIVNMDEDAYTITITPADIVIYTGGDGYSGVTVDENGTPLENATESGLPEPGYHLTLPGAVEKWLKEQGVDMSVAADLANYLHFRYYDKNGTMTRNWDLEDQGIYSMEGDTVTAYVYSLSTNTVEGEFKDTPVRLEFTNNGEIVTNDIIEMDENTASATYQMTIYDGGLDQSQIKAVFNVGDKTITCNVNIGTGDLTVKSVADENPDTNAIAANGDAVADGTLAAVDNSTVDYYVNDSEVKIENDADRVQLLVDSVSNNDSFNNTMAQDAISEVVAKHGALSDAQTDMAYLDLVDTQNGNAVVTMGDNDELTIYWPMPADADPNGEFHVVHYTDMNRTDTTTAEDLGATEILTVSKDDNHLTFTTDSFSPFVLVYEQKDSGTPTPPVTDPDDKPTPPPVDPDDKPELNTEDHYAYIVGYEDGTVRPEGDITRAEVATIFFRLLTDESRNEYWSQTNDYTDVAEGDWYNNAVSTLSKAGILNGYEDGSFQPNGNITRAEFATIAARFFEATYEGEDLFPDIAGHWARDYINQAAHAGIVNGYPDGTFQPQETITRAEAMTIVNRTLDRHPDADHFLADMITWPDNLESAWYYEQVQEATNSHEYVMKTDKDQNRYEDWTKLLEIRDWSDLENTWSEAHAG